VFQIWFLPLIYPPTRVKLTTVLTLKHEPAPSVSSQLINAAKAADPKSDTPSFAEVADPKEKTEEKIVGHGKYYITAQDDLYQSSEALAFCIPYVGRILVVLFGYWATLVCVLLALVGYPVSKYEDTKTTA
jgi:hypothetical protein